MNVKFPDTLAQPWDELVTELKDRCLPPDHSLKVKLRFNTTTQRSWLEESAERFQTVDAALALAGVNKSDKQKVTSFTRGLKDTEDRLFCPSAVPSQPGCGDHEASPCPVLILCHEEQA